MKYQSGKGYALTPIERADQEYRNMKQNANRATVEDVLAFLKKHDGDPPQDFIKRVQSSLDERQFYTEQLARVLADEGCSDDFFSLTGKRLDLNFALAEAWAEQIATELFGPPPTLQ